VNVSALVRLATYPTQVHGLNKKKMTTIHNEASNKIRLCMIGNLFRKIMILEAFDEDDNNQEKLVNSSLADHKAAASFLPSLGGIRGVDPTIYPSHGPSISVQGIIGRFLYLFGIQYG